MPELGTGDKEQEQTDDADNSGRAEIRFKNDQNAQEADFKQILEQLFRRPDFFPGRLQSWRKKNDKHHEGQFRRLKLDEAEGYPPLGAMDRMVWGYKQNIGKQYDG